MTNEKFREIVGQAIGSASVAWSELPKGVFDSTVCSSLVDEIMLAHQEALKILATDLMSRALKCSVDPTEATNPRDARLRVSERLSDLKDRVLADLVDKITSADKPPQTADEWVRWAAKECGVEEISDEDLNSKEYRRLGEALNSFGKQEYARALSDTIQILDKTTDRGHGLLERITDKVHALKG